MGWTDGADWKRLEAKGTCKACGGPTEAPWCAEESVCERCGEPSEEEKTRVFQSPLAAWAAGRPRGARTLDGCTEAGNEFHGEIDLFQEA